MILDIVLNGAVAVALLFTGYYVWRTRKDSPTATTPPRYVCKIMTWDPETRWLHRVILRRKLRERTLAYFVPQNAVWNRPLNGPETFKFDGHNGDGWVDPLALLANSPAPDLPEFLQTCPTCGAKPGEPCDAGLHS